jgi:1,4-dihydroxy-2-naphthoate octaprenyltransferase
VVKYGFQKGKSYHYLLVLVGANFCLLTVLVSAQKLLHFLPLMPLVLLVPHVKKVAATETPALLDPELKKVALTTFLFALLFWMTAA